MMNRFQQFVWSSLRSVMPVGLIFSALIVPCAPLLATDYFIDIDMGDDNNDGQHAVPFELTDADWDGTDTITTTTDISSYTPREGDVVWLEPPGTEFTAGLYEIDDKINSNSFTVTTAAAEALGGSSIEGITSNSHDGPWKTINMATKDGASGGVVGPGDRVFIRKGTTAYVASDGGQGSVMYLRTKGTVENGIHFRGWDTDYLTDLTYAVFDAAAHNLVKVVTTHTTGDWHVTLENIHVKCDPQSMQTNGFEFTNRRNVQFIHCQAEGAKQDGIRADGDSALINCDLHDNKQNTVDDRCIVLGSSFYDNTGTGLRIGAWSTVSTCLFYDNGGTTGSQIHSAKSLDGACLMFNTLDGGIGLGPAIGAAGILIEHTGMSEDPPNRANFFNNIIYNCSTGIETEWTDVDVRNHIYSDNNWFYDNTSNYDPEWPAGVHDVIGEDPQFNNVNAHDYRPNNACLGVLGFGLDPLQDYETSPMHVGALPPTTRPTGSCP